MQRQQVVFSKLEACGILRPQLPNTVQKQQEHRGLPEGKGTLYNPFRLPTVCPVLTPVRTSEISLREGGEVILIKDHMN